MQSMAGFLKKLLDILDIFRLEKTGLIVNE